MAKVLDYFPCYHSYRQTLSILSYEEKGRLFDTLLAYSAGDMEFVEKMKLNEKTKVAFSFIKGDIDRSREHYQEVCEKRSAAGKQGGRPPKNADVEPDDEADVDDEEKQKNQMVILESKKRQSKSKSKSKSKSNNDVSKDTSSSEEEVDSCPYKKIMDLYNSICKSLPSIRLMSEDRKTHVKARWKTYQSLDLFEELFTLAESSDFLTGNNDRGWKADFDWLMNEQNMTKVLENKYSVVRQQSTQQPTSTGDRLLKMIREGVFDEPEG